MINTKEKKTSDNENPIKDVNKSKRLSSFDIRKRITAIGISKKIKTITIYSFITIIIVFGFLAGIFGRFVLDAPLQEFQIEDFKISLQSEPIEEKNDDLRAFTDRPVSRYSSQASGDRSFQIIVLHNTVQAENQAEEINLQVEKNKITEEFSGDLELREFSEKIVAVLCADEQKNIRKNCLMPGSRNSRWMIRTEDGSEIYGSITKSRKGNLVMLIAAGGTEEQAFQFFDSFSSK